MAVRGRLFGRRRTRLRIGRGASGLAGLPDGIARHGVVTRGGGGTNWTSPAPVTTRQAS